MQFSPKLKSVKQQIEKILKDNDVAGIMVLHTQQYGSYWAENLYHLSPTKSAVKLVNGEMKIQIRKAEPEKAEYTCDMLHALATTGGEMILSLLDTSKRIDDILDADHTNLGFTPDTLLDN